MTTIKIDIFNLTFRSCWNQACGVGFLKTLGVGVGFFYRTPGVQ